MALYNEGSGGGTSAPVGSGALAGALAGGIGGTAVTRRPKRARQSTVRPPVAAAPPGVDTGAAFDPGKAVDRLAQRQQELQNAQQAAELDALINRLRSEEEMDMSDFNAQLRGIPQRQELLEGDARRGALTTGAIGRRGLAGRGLALSGIRAGFEGRTEGDLLRRLGVIGQQSQSEGDAIRRAIQRLKQTTEDQVSQAMAKKQALI